MGKNMDKSDKSKKEKILNYAINEIYTLKKAVRQKRNGNSKHFEKSEKLESFISTCNATNQSKKIQNHVETWINTLPKNCIYNTFDCLSHDANLTIGRDTNDINERNYLKFAKIEPIEQIKTSNDSAISNYFDSNSTLNKNEIGMNTFDYILSNTWMYQYDSKIKSNTTMYNDTINDSFFQSYQQVSYTSFTHTQFWKPSFFCKSNLIWWKNLIYFIRKNGIEIKDFGPSWRDGLAFAHLLKNFVDIPLDEFKNMTSRERLEKVFDLAQQKLNIPPLLDPNDIDVDKPEERSIMSYLSLYQNKNFNFHQFEKKVFCEIEDVDQWINYTERLLENINGNFNNVNEEYTKYSNFYDKNVSVKQFLDKMYSQNNMTESQFDSYNIIFKDIDQKCEKWQYFINSHLLPNNSIIMEWIMKIQDLLNNSSEFTEKLSSDHFVYGSEMDTIDNLNEKKQNIYNEMNNFNEISNIFADEYKKLQKQNYNESLIEYIDKIKSKLLSIPKTFKNVDLLIDFWIFYLNIVFFLQIIEEGLSKWTIKFDNFRELENIYVDFNKIIEKSGMQKIMQGFTENLKKTLADINELYYDKLSTEKLNKQTNDCIKIWNSYKENICHIENNLKTTKHNWLKYKSKCDIIETTLLNSEKEIFQNTKERDIQIEELKNVIISTKHNISELSHLFEILNNNLTDKELKHMSVQINMYNRQLNDVNNSYNTKLKDQKLIDFLNDCQDSVKITSVFINDCLQLFKKKILYENRDLVCYEESIEKLFKMLNLLKLKEIDEIYYKCSKFKEKNQEYTNVTIINEKMNVMHNLLFHIQNIDVELSKRNEDIKLIIEQRNQFSVMDLPQWTQHVTNKIDSGLNRTDDNCIDVLMKYVNECSQKCEYMENVLDSIEKLKNYKYIDISNFNCKAITLKESLHKLYEQLLDLLKKEKLLKKLENLNKEIIQTKHDVNVTDSKENEDLQSFLDKTESIKQEFTNLSKSSIEWKDLEIKYNESKQLINDLNNSVQNQIMKNKFNKLHIFRGELMNMKNKMNNDLNNVEINKQSFDQTYTDISTIEIEKVKIKQKLCEYNELVRKFDEENISNFNSTDSTNHEFVINVESDDLVKIVDTFVHDTKSNLEENAIKINHFIKYCGECEGKLKDIINNFVSEDTVNALPIIEKIETILILRENVKDFQNYVKKLKKDYDNLQTTIWKGNLLECKSKLENVASSTIENDFNELLISSHTTLNQDILSRVEEYLTKNLHIKKELINDNYKDSFKFEDEYQNLENFYKDMLVKYEEMRSLETKCTYLNDDKIEHGVDNMVESKIKEISQMHATLNCDIIEYQQKLNKYITENSNVLTEMNNINNEIEESLKKIEEKPINLQDISDVYNDANFLKTMESKINNTFDKLSQLQTLTLTDKNKLKCENLKKKTKLISESIQLKMQKSLDNIKLLENYNILFENVKNLYRTVKLQVEDLKNVDFVNYKEIQMELLVILLMIRGILKKFHCIRTSKEKINVHSGDITNLIYKYQEIIKQNLINISVDSDEIISNFSNLKNQIDTKLRICEKINEMVDQFEEIKMSLKNIYIDASIDDYVNLENVNNLLESLNLKQSNLHEMLNQMIEIKELEKIVKMISQSLNNQEDFINDSLYEMYFTETQIEDKIQSLINKTTREM
ncbi:hypothetical protein A3Q56_04997, partial [Intoshia linei]